MKGVEFYALLQIKSALSVSEAAGFYGFPCVGRTTFPTDLGVMGTALGNNATDSCSSYPTFSSFSWITTEKVAVENRPEGGEELFHVDI